MKDRRGGRPARLGADVRAGRRAPLLVPSPQGWAGRAFVREMRVRVEAGALLVERPGATVERRAAPGEVTRVVLLDGDGLGGQSGGSALLPVGAHGLLVFLTTEGPVLSLWLSEWLPVAARDADGVIARETSGVNAVAAALGVSVEPGDPSIAAAALDPTVLVRPQPALATRYRVLLVAGYAAVATWFGWTAVGRVTGNPRPAAIGQLGALGALVLVAVWLLVRRDATRRLSPPPGQEVAPRPVDPVSRGFRERCRLYVSPEWVVLVDGVGREAWMPGPALGGITQAALTTSAVVLDDGDGNGLASLPRRAWLGAPGSEAAMRAALASAGIPVRDEPSNRTPGAWLASPEFLEALDDPLFGNLRERTGVPARAGFVGGFGGAVGCASALVLGEPWTAVLAAVPACVAVGPGLGGRLAARRAKEVS